MEEGGGGGEAGEVLEAFLLLLRVESERGAAELEAVEVEGSDMTTGFRG